MLNSFWSFIYIGVVFLLILLAVIQLSKSFGNPIINVLQLLAYVGIFVMYWMNIVKGGSFGIFLRVSTLLFIFLFALEILNFPKGIEEKKQKLLLVLLSIFKLAPLVLIIFKLTEAYM